MSAASMGAPRLVAKPSPGPVERTRARIVRYTQDVRRLFILPPLAPTRSLPAEIIITMTIIITASTAAWLRLDGVRGVMWAEDANVFTQRAATPSLQSASILTPYAGYTHSLPQLLANIIWATVRAEHVAVATTAACCVVAGMVAAAIFVLTARWPLTTWTRATVALITVLAPAVQVEVLGNLANLHWLLLWLAPFLFLYRPRSWVSACISAVAAFLVVTTEIQSLAFAPLLGLWLGERRRWPVVFAVLGGAATQVIALIGNDVTRGAGERPWAVIAQVYALQVPLTAVVGSTDGAAALIAASGWIVAAGAVVPFLLVAVALARRSTFEALLTAIFVGGSLILWVAGFGINYFEDFNYVAMSPAELVPNIQTLRYAVVPIMLLLATLAMIASRRRQRESPRLRTWFPPLIVCVTIFAIAFSSGSHGFREGGPNWRAEIATAEAQCDVHSGAYEVTISAAPTNWGVTVPCRVLDR